MEILKSKLTNAVLIGINEPLKKYSWVNIDTGKEVYAYNTEDWEKIIIDAREISSLKSENAELKDKLKRRNMLVRDLRAKLNIELAKQPYEQNFIPASTWRLMSKDMILNSIEIARRVLELEK